MIWLGSGIALSTAFFWALAVHRYSDIESRWGPFAANFGRTAFGAPLFLAVSISLGLMGTGTLGQIRAENIGWLSASVIGSYVLGDSLFLIAARWIGVSSALAIASCYPFWAALAGAIWLNQELTSTKVLGMVLVVLGTIVVILAGKSGKRPIHRHGVFGVATAILVSLGWALNSFCTAKGAQGISLWDANLVRMTAGLAGNSLILWVFRQKFLPKSEIARSAPIFFMETFLGSALYVAAMSMIPLGIAATLASVSPLFSVPLGVLQGRERFSLQKMAGMVLALTGLAFLVI